MSPMEQAGARTVEAMYERSITSMKAKKLFSALLAVVMVFGLLCTPAFAAGKADTLAAGPISVADNEDYYNSFEWAYGENTFGGHMVDYPGCHTLTTDFLVEKFGANTLLMFWGGGAGTLYRVPADRQGGPGGRGLSLGGSPH